MLGEATFHHSTVPNSPTRADGERFRRSYTAAKGVSLASVELRVAPRESVENAGRGLERFRLDKLAPLPFRPSNSSDGAVALNPRY